MLSKTSVFMCATLQVCNFANPFANALRRNLRQRNIPWSTWQLRGPHGSSGQLQAAPLVHMAAPGTFLTSRWVHPWSTCHPEATIRYLEESVGPHGSSAYLPHIQKGPSGGPHVIQKLPSGTSKGPSGTSKSPCTFLTSRWVHPWSTCHPEATIRYLEVQHVPHMSNYLCTKTDSVIARGIARFHPPRG